ncbi:MAG TPA: hypothetical protein DCS15_05560 [Flavobacteriales bacterium]|nr:hypothetical protein [Flavobacteriales bacterium]
MKSSIFLGIISLVFSTLCFGQKGESWTEFDTIKVYPGRILLEYKTYIDSVLTEQGGAFHYPDSSKLPKTNTSAKAEESSFSLSEVQLHGTVKHINKDGKYRVGHYVKGRKVSMRYYDADGAEISSKDFGNN